MRPRQAGPTLVASRKRQNPAFKTPEWVETPEDEIGFEREMAVRALVERDTYLMQYRPRVFSVLNPDGAADIGDYADSMVSPENHVFLVMEPGSKNKVGYQSYVHEGIDQLVNSLNEQWPMTGMKWERITFGWGDLGEMFEIALLSLDRGFDFGDDEIKPNPQMTRQEAERKFYELLRDPDPAAFDVALDIVEEHELNLVDLSQDGPADPVWLGEPVASDEVSHGMLVIGQTPAPDTPMWWVPGRGGDASPGDRDLLMRDPDFVLVEWGVYLGKRERDKQSGYWFDIDLWRSRGREGRSLLHNVGWAMFHGFPNFQTKYDAEEAAMEALLMVTRAYKETPSESNEHLYGMVRREFSEYLARQSDAPSSGKNDVHDNPAQFETRADAEQAFRALLSESTLTPDIIQMAQDVVEQGSKDGPLTLAQISRDEFSVSPVLDEDIGEFRLGTYDANVSVGWMVGARNRQGERELIVIVRYGGSEWSDPTLRHKQFGPDDDSSDESYEAYRVWRRDHGDSRLRVKEMDEGTYRVVELAWNIVKVIVNNWGATVHSMKNAIATSVPYREVPITPPTLISKYGQHVKWTVPKDNPCDEAPRQNPAWVTKHLADSWVTLEQKVPAQWMPKLDRTVNKGKRLSAEIPEYGCGAYGCVLPTLDPKIVLKLTTDDTEAQFAARLAKELPVPIVTKYELVYHLPTARRQGRDVYLLWRESAEHVGEIDKVVGSHAEDAIAKQHKVAQAAFDRLHHGEDATRELTRWTEAVKDMGQVKDLRWLANGLLAAFEQKGIFFGDIHGGNLGLVGGKWVITDPGHIAVIPR